jgi:hypothetical protein
MRLSFGSGSGGVLQAGRPLPTVPAAEVVSVGADRLRDALTALRCQQLNWATWRWSASHRHGKVRGELVGVSRFVTRFGSLASFQQGRVEVIDDDPRHYAFSNIFQVASHARPWEQVAVGQNRQYVLEVLRAEGISPWRTCAHDQSALIMDGQVQVELTQPGPGQQPPAGQQGSVAVTGEPGGARMGQITARRGHLVLLPAGACYRMSAAQPGVVLLQTIAGADTQYRWAQICQTS